jgi:hypothetical protein
VRLGDVGLALAADVLDLGAGAKPRILHFGAFGERTLELRALLG